MDKTSGLPGGLGQASAEIQAVVLKAAKSDPQVKAPAPGIVTGSRPTADRRHGQPAPILPRAQRGITPAHPSRRAAASPARDHPHQPEFSRPATAPPGEKALWVYAGLWHPCSSRAAGTEMPGAFTGLPRRAVPGRMRG
jgi:hypothetical protein